MLSSSSGRIFVAYSSAVHKVTTQYHNLVSQPGNFYEAVLNGLAAMRCQLMVLRELDAADVN